MFKSHPSDKEKYGSMRVIRLVRTFLLPSKMPVSKKAIHDFLTLVEMNGLCNLACKAFRPAILICNLIQCMYRRKFYDSLPAALSVLITILLFRLTAETYNCSNRFWCGPYIQRISFLLRYGRNILYNVLTNI